MKILFIQKVKALVGSEKYFLALIPALEKKGIKIEFICIYNEFDEDKTLPFIHEYKKLGLKIHVLKTNSDKSILKILRFIYKVYKTGNFNLIHSHLIHADLWSTLLKRLRLIKTPIVSTKHGYDENYISKKGFDGFNLPKNIYYHICKFSERKMERSIAVSNGLKQLFIDGKITKSENIETIHHGFDLPELSQKLNPKFRFSPNQFIIVGRIIPFKGHIYAISALKKIKQEIPDFKLVILGHGNSDLIEELRTSITKYKLEDNVLFLGYKSNIYDYLSNSDIMIVPSIAEGFGLVFLEAMNANLPIIGFDVAATNEIIKHDSTGILITPYDSDLLAEGLVKLMKNKIYRNKLGDEAKKRLVSYFCLNRMVDQTISFYQKALEKREQ